MRVMAMDKVNPYIEINPAAIRDNAACIAAKARPFGCEIVGVTKGCCGYPPVAQAMLDGGIRMLGDSRLENILRMRQAGINAAYLLLRIPMLSEAAAVVELADISLNSEVAVMEALGRFAVRRGTVHRVILMVDLGDLREGVMPADVLPTVARIGRLPGIELAGVGTNLACYGGVIPDKENMAALLQLREEIQRVSGKQIAVVSGGNSANLQMLWRGELPPGINQLRVGEGILLGNETIERQKMPGLRQDAFCLYAEIIELKIKPSVPHGRIGQNALGEVPRYADQGPRARAILALGRQDVMVDGLLPLDEQVHIIGSSSDHLIADVTDSAVSWQVGMKVPFAVKYGALMTAMASSYVRKNVITSGSK